MRLMIDGPGVLGRAGARGQARHQGVEGFPLEAVARQRRPVLDVAESERGARQQLRAVFAVECPADAGARPHEAHHRMPSPQQRAHRGAADRAGGAEHEDAPRPHSVRYGEVGRRGGRQHGDGRRCPDHGRGVPAIVHGQARSLPSWRVPDPDCARGIRDAGLTVAPRGWHPDPGRTGDRSPLDDLEPDDPRQRQADAAAMGDRNGAMGPHKGHDAG
jgi:hypothetical protein